MGSRTGDLSVRDDHLFAVCQGVRRVMTTMGGDSGVRTVRELKLPQPNLNDGGGGNCPDASPNVGSTVCKSAQKVGNIFHDC